MSGKGNVVSAKEDCAPSCIASVVKRFDSGAWEELFDYVIEEELIDVFVNGSRAFTLVCSPCNLYELTIGRLFTEGCIERGCSIDGYVYDRTRKRIFVEVGSFSQDFARTTSPSNRMCSNRFSIRSADLLAFMDLMESSSHVFHSTGGAHSAALAYEGSIVARYDDLGRFNAIDKLAGWCFCHDVDTSNAALLFSGRIPFEVVAKVVRIGCPVIASPGAPTSLSIEFAQRAGVAIVGFAKGSRLNVYTHRERISDAQNIAVG